MQIIYHLSKVKNKNEVIIRATVTDIAIIVLGNLSKIDPTIKVWMEVGHFSNNSQKFINLREFFSNLGVTVCNALPDFHAFTGCDYDSAFYGKGKTRPFNVLTKNPDICQTFNCLGLKPNLVDTITGALEKFTGLLYNKKM